MTPQELRRSITEYASMLHRYSVVDASVAVQATASRISGNFLRQEFEKMYRLVIPYTAATGPAMVAANYLSDTALKAISALHTSIELANSNTAGSATYQDINKISDQPERLVAEKHYDLLLLILETLKPVRKKFYSDSDLAHFQGRVRKEALNSVTKICMQETADPHINAINACLEEFFDEVPLILAAGEYIGWIKILVEYSMKITTAPATRNDIQALELCLSLLRNAEGIIRVKHHIAATTSVASLETSFQYMSNLLQMATSKAKDAFRNHRQLYPDLEAKIKHLLDLGKKIESLQFYMGDELLFFKYRQQHLVSLIDEFLSFHRENSTVPNGNLGVLTSREALSNSMMSRMADPACFVQISPGFVDRNHSGFMGPVKILQLEITGAEASPPPEVCNIVSAFQNELRSVLTTVHYLDSIILRDFDTLLGLRRPFTSDHNCDRCSYIHNTNTSHYVAEYIKLAVATLRGCATNYKEYEEDTIYVSSALLINALARHTGYKNFPKPSHIYSNIVRTQEQFIGYQPCTKQEFLDYFLSLEREVMSCILTIPLDNKEKTQIADHGTLSLPSSASVGLPLQVSSENAAVCLELDMRASSPCSHISVSSSIADHCNVLVTDEICTQGTSGSPCWNYNPDAPQCDLDASTVTLSSSEPIPTVTHVGMIQQNIPLQRNACSSTHVTMGLDTSVTPYDINSSAVGYLPASSPHQDVMWASYAAVSSPLYIDSVIRVNSKYDASDLPLYYTSAVTVAQSANNISVNANVLGGNDSTTRSTEPSPYYSNCPSANVPCSNKVTQSQKSRAACAQTLPFARVEPTKPIALAQNQPSARGYQPKVPAPHTTSLEALNRSPHISETNGESSTPETLSSTQYMYDRYKAGGAYRISSFTQERIRALVANIEDNVQDHPQISGGFKEQSPLPSTSGYGAKKCAINPPSSTPVNQEVCSNICGNVSAHHGNSTTLESSLPLKKRHVNTAPGSTLDPPCTLVVPTKPQRRQNRNVSSSRTSRYRYAFSAPGASSQPTGMVTEPSSAVALPHIRGSQDRQECTPTF